MQIIKSCREFKKALSAEPDKSSIEDKSTEIKKEEQIRCDNQS